MKLLKYIAVLAVLSISGLAYAQTAPAAEKPAVAVSTSMENGVVKIEIKMDVTNPLESTEDAIKKAVAEALKASGAETNYAKAISAAVSALKSAIKDPNFPAKGSVVLNVALKNSVVENNPAIEAQTTLEVGGQKFDAVTRSVFTPDGKVVTTGNVTSPNGPAAPIVVTTSPDGKITGSIGDATVADKTPSAENEEMIITSPEDKALSGDSRAEVVPDNTIVATTER